MTVTATDGSGFHGSATFTWTITNTVAVTNPGTQSSVSGTAITALQISATDSQSGGHPHLHGHRPAGRPDHLLLGRDHRHPDHGRPYSVTVTATDEIGFHGSATFTWNITNTVSVTNPGTQSNVSGSAITTLQISATDS